MIPRLIKIFFRTVSVGNYPNTLGLLCFWPEFNVGNKRYHMKICDVKFTVCSLSLYQFVASSAIQFLAVMNFLWINLY